MNFFKKKLQLSGVARNGLTTYSEKRPWGSFLQFTHNISSTVKIITVAPHEELSLQYHEKRSEFWYVLSGSPSITIGENVLSGSVGQDFFVPQRINHRIKAGDTEVKILEIALVEFDEQDIVRLEDKYGRTTTSIAEEQDNDE